MKGDEVSLCVDDFCAWLCEREDRVVGRPGIGLNDPLSEWISARVGRVWGVDARRYGPACLDSHLWQWLPVWGQLFVLFTERYMFARPLTGGEAFHALVEVERQAVRLAK